MDISVQESSSASKDAARRRRRWSGDVHLQPGDVCRGGGEHRVHRATVNKLNLESVLPSAATEGGCWKFELACQTGERGVDNKT